MSAPSTPTVLARILVETRAELERRKRARPLPLTAVEGHKRAHPLPATAGEGAAWPERGQSGAHRFRDALRAEGIGVIAEFKRRSPSAGSLHDAPDLERIVRAYERGGAAAISVLTEGPNFGGSLEDLRAARAACELPLLRKDFVVDTYQLHEAVAVGADAVLLIVAALTTFELSSLHATAGELGLDVLVEVHDRAELERALSLGAEIVGVNNRDLRDFSVDVSRTETLLGEIPASVTVVSESGIAGAEQVRALGERGVDGVLVGESLMRADDPAAALRALLGPTRARVGRP